LRYKVSCVNLQFSSFGKSFFKINLIKIKGG
jgi:hypothetical protein